MTQNLGKLKIIHNEKDHEYTLWKTNERDEWERCDAYSAGSVFVEDYDEYCDWSVEACLLEDVMNLVNEGYTFSGTEIIEHKE